jgi:hypothetical protein
VNKRTLSILILAIVLSIIGVYSFWNEKHKENLLVHNIRVIRVKGIFISRNETPVHGSSSINVKYKVGNVSYMLKERVSFPGLKVGDTVLVEYAIEDNSVARVVGKLKK